VLYDLGQVSTPEPFFKLVNQGLILGEDSQKMSKSLGNVVNPDSVLQVYGADAFRLYEMFMGPLEMVKPWSTQGVEGVYRFLGRVWRLFIDEASETEFEQAETLADPDRAAHEPAELLKLLKLHSSVQDVQPEANQLRVLQACIKKVTEDLEGLRFNTAISAMMVFAKEAGTWTVRPVAVLREFLILLQPFAPHVAEELWARLKTADPRRNDLSLPYQPWPEYDPALLVQDTIEIPVQVNGKLREVLTVPRDISREALEAQAEQAPKVQAFLTGKTVRKKVVVPGRLVNLVVG
jgi:leucyl-tRNA synthetase